MLSARNPNWRPYTLKLPVCAEGALVLERCRGVLRVALSIAVDDAQKGHAKRTKVCT